MERGDSMNRLRAVVIAILLASPASGATLTLVAAPNPATFGQGSVTMTATLSGYSGGDKVTFYDGTPGPNNVIGAVNVGGSGSTRNVQLNKSNFSAGTHNLSATCCVSFFGDGDYSGSTTLTVNKATPTVTFSSNLNPSTFGQTVTLSANVPFNATGSITFLSGNNPISSPQSIFGGSVVMNTVFSPGTYSLTARYNGDSNYNPNTSSPITQVVNKVTTTTTLSSSQNPSSAGQTVTLMAAVQPNGPTGTVNFLDGQTLLGSVNLSNPTVSFTTSSLSSGSHSLTAAYSGDGNFSASTSTAITQTVVSAGSRTITSLSPSTAAAGGAGFTLIINGTGFIQGAAAQWNGASLTTTFVNATQVTAAVPASLIASAGTAIIKVITGGGATNGAPFTVNPPGQSCIFSFSPLNAAFAAGGGPGSSLVTASRNDCTWNATSNVNWITFPGGSITGSGTLNYNVGVNSAGTSRTGTITAGFQSFSVTQGGTACTFTLPSSSQAFGPAGGSGTAAVQAPPGCNWTANNGGVPFVTITSPGSGSGSGTVGYTVAANPSANPRSAVLAIANRPYTVVQSGSGSTVSCTVAATSAPQVQLEGLTEAAGGIAINCSGLSGTIKADITLTLNTNVTNPLNGAINPLLTVNGGSPLSGVVTGYNAIRFAGVSLAPAANGTVNMTIAQVCANANQLGVPGNLQPIPITGQVSIGALAVVPVIGAQQTMATVLPALIFTKTQAIPPAGGSRTLVPLVFQESDPSSFQANGTRLRAVLTNLPGTVQVFAPVFPSEGASRAQLYSADANGSGGSPLSGGPIPEGQYQQLTITGGTATATWPVLAADAAQAETWTFPLVLLNATTNDLNQIRVAGSLGPVSDVNVASPTEPVPRYRDFSVPQKLVNLRVTTSVAVQAPGGAAAALKPLLHAAAAFPQKDAIDVGSKVTFTHQLVNDTSDPTQTATNVVIRDNLPSGLTLISCTAPGASCGGTGNQVQVNSGSIAPGQVVTVTVVAQVDPSLAGGTLLENPVIVGSDEVNQDLLAATASTSFIVLNGVPVAVGQTPASGSGNTQNFTFQFSHPSGFQNLGVVNILINNFLDGLKACYLAYIVQSSTLVLVDDQGHAGGPFAGAAVLGDTSTIQNGQCGVVLTNAVGSGSTLTLTLNITFKPAFGGNRIVFVAARDQAQGNTDWQALGVWQVPFTPPGAIAVTGVSPPRDAGPAGANKQFTFSFTDSNGAGNFGIVNVLVNKFIDAKNACYLAYIASINTLVLVNDAGDAGGPFAGAMVLNGVSASMENAQCQISSVGSTVTPGPNSLSLTLNITFKPAFAGNRVLYLAGRDVANGNNTDWQAAGTFTVQ